MEKPRGDCMRRNVRLRFFSRLNKVYEEGRKHHIRNVDVQSFTWLCGCYYIDNISVGLITY
jgi:hypothetical protein